MGQQGGIWTEQERRAWAPPERLTPSVWTERYRVLPPSISPEPGPYRLARTPYWRDVLDAVAEIGVEEIVCLKPAQIGWSELTRNILGYWVDNDPGPILIVMPSQESAREIVDEKIRSLVETTPAVSRHLSDRASDFTKSTIKFDTCTLHVGWAGSPNALATRTVRYGLLDEVDKYPLYAGREADPVSLAKERTKTYKHRRKVLIGSTPTLRTGFIWRAYEGCGDKRRFYVPCPHCGEYQPLVWTGVKWPKLDIADKQKTAEAVEQKNLAYYECQHCHGQIVERQRLPMLSRGVWLSEGQTIDRAGQVRGERPRAKRVGFWLNALYSPWCSFSDVAAEGLRSMGDQQRWQNFKNSWLAEVFEEQVSVIKVSELASRVAGSPPPLVVPQWAGVLIASADTQKDRVYWVVRAWGKDYRSQLIHFGVALTFDELYRLTLGASYQVDGLDFRVSPHLLLIDSGGTVSSTNPEVSRTDEVYEFARHDPARILPLKGANSTTSLPWEYSGKQNQLGITLVRINTQFYKDRLNTLRGDPDRWLLNKAVTDEYLAHQAAEHKIWVREKGIYLWQPQSAGAPNHYFDCCVYNCCGADIAHIELLTDSQTFGGQHQQQQQQQKQQQQKQQQQQHQQRQQSWVGGNSGSGWTLGKRWL